MSTSSTLPPASMHLLVIGGGRFVGRHLVQAALAAGHRVTVFNRGQTSDVWPDGVAHLRGDRRLDLSALHGRRWDAVIDCCGYLPSEVAALGAALAGHVPRCVFISSISVYGSFVAPNTEDSPLGAIDDVDTTVVDGRTYGPLKALCEAEVQRAWGQGALIIRPGLVVGPDDPTGRFSWWPARWARAAAADELRVLTPGTPDDPLQLIDVRDLAAFTLAALARGEQGAFNVCTDPGSLTSGALQAACAEAAGASATPAWAPSVWLEARDVGAWMAMPLWLGTDAAMAAFMGNHNQRARAAGLQLRPLLQTVADTLAWWRALPAEKQAFPQTGLSPEREAELLAALSETQD